MTMGFGFVWAFVLLLIPAALIVYRRLFESRRIAPVRSAGSELWAKVRPSWRVRLRWLPFALRCWC